VYSAVNGVVDVEYGITPAGKSGRKFFSDLDIIYAVLGVAATGVGIVSLCCPVAFPVIAG
jgi:hypothetical protein